MKIVAVVLCLCACLTSSTIAAQDMHFELGARGGISAPTHGDIAENYAAGWVAGLSGGMRFRNGLTPRLELGYCTLTDNETMRGVHKQGHLIVNVGLRWYVPVRWRVVPFVGAHAGVHLGFNGQGTTEAPIMMGKELLGSRDYSAFAGVALGSEFVITRNVSMDVEGRYDVLPSEDRRFFYPRVPGGGLLRATVGVLIHF
jgi:hypothetical protein